MRSSRHCDPLLLVLLLTTHETFHNRHGPRAYHHWKHGQVPKDFGAKDDMLPSPEAQDEWPADLRDAFDVAVVDEAHMLANPYRQTNQAFAWLNAQFNVLVTATPVSSHAGNLSGLIALVEQPGSTSEAMAKLGVQVDPFTLPDDDPLADLRFTHHAWEVFCVPERSLARAGGGRP